MNRYGRQVHDHYRNHRPDDLAKMADPSSYFEEIGGQAQAAITSLRDEILAAPGPDENMEDFRLRSYQALRRAEEIVLAEILTTPDLDSISTSPDQVSTAAAARLAALNRTLSSLAGDWTETAPGTP